MLRALILAAALATPSCESFHDWNDHIHRWCPVLHHPQSSAAERANAIAEILRAGDTNYPLDDYASRCLVEALKHAGQIP